MFEWIASLAAVALVLALVRAKLVTVVVRPHQAALLIKNGVERGLLPVGVHRFWLGRVDVALFDLRDGLQKIGGQEVLTRDRVPVRFTVLVRRRVVDAVRLFHAVQVVDEHVHAEAQIALRDAVAAVALDELLDDRVAVGARMKAALAASLESVGIELVDATLQDIVVHGDLKRAYGDVAKARAEGAARLERARGEAAAMRTLANAARLLQEHQGLDRLMTLGVARAAAEGTQNTLVLGLDDPRRALGGP
jgi:regulator of protease activity HflC (stomatin/prohibitin superfamily)